MSARRTRRCAVLARLAGAVLTGAVLISGCASRPVTSTVGQIEDSLGSKGTTVSEPPTSPAATGNGASVGVVSSGSASAGPGRVVPSTPDRSSSPPRTTAPMRTGATARFDETDSGAVVSVHVGAHLVVTLAGSWTPPRPDSTVLRTDASRGYPAKAPASAELTAVRVGTTVVRAMTDAPCLHASPPCRIAQHEFSITVRVLP